MKRWVCTDCKLEFPSTLDYWYQNQLDRVNTNPNRISIGGKCKPCAIEYSKRWRENIKQRGLTRSQKNTSLMAKAVTGTLYVIGPDIPGTPYKIGITSGSNTQKRKTSLQTAHWMTLKEIWKSDLTPRIDKIETLIHEHFNHVHVRGEWFNISKDDIESIPELIEKFKRELIK
jgi:hypothetical protein